MEEAKPGTIQENSGRNPDGTYKPGVSGHLEGKPKGSKHQRTFADIFLAVKEAIALETGQTPEAVEELLIKVAYEKAKQGDHQFYKDIMDRIHGKPIQPIANALGEAFVMKVITYEDHHNSLPVPTEGLPAESLEGAPEI